MKIPRYSRIGFLYARAIVLALLTPLFEKNPSKHKTLSRCRVPMMLSMARVIVLLFAAALLHQVRRNGVAGWPEATLCISVVLALPLLGALERLKPEQVAEFGTKVIGRFGVGGTGTEPNKHDDHRNDT